LPSSGDQFSSLTADTQSIKPEKFQNYEVGVKWDIRRNLSFTSALYRLDRTNTRASTAAGVLELTGSQRTNGFELGLNGNPFRNWSVSGGYAYQDAFISSTTSAAAAGTTVAQVPHHSFSLWNKYQFMRRLSAGLGLIRRSDMFASINSVPSRIVLPAYTRIDGAVFYSFNEHWRLQANVENILDTRYYQNADNNTNISPGSPRAAKVALVARF
jgi:catecholate siderophore receptor